MDDEQERRIAHNESRFRELNERVKDAIQDFHPQVDAQSGFAILCECAVTECADMIDVSIAEYQRVRKNPRWHIVRPDHVIEAAETAVERHEEYWVIEKVGLGGEIAEDLAR